LSILFPPFLYSFLCTPLRFVRGVFFSLHCCMQLGIFAWLMRYLGLLSMFLLRNLRLLRARTHLVFVLHLRDFLFLSEHLVASFLLSTSCRYCCVSWHLSFLFFFFFFILCVTPAPCTYPRTSRLLWLLQGHRLVHWILQNSIVHVLSCLPINRGLLSRVFLVNS
jgi:hypothetical protein